MTVAKRAEANVQQAVPFFWVQDMERSVRFYVDGLGFEMTKEWNDEGKLRWGWLQLAALRLRRSVGRKVGAPIYRKGNQVKV